MDNIKDDIKWACSKFSLCLGGVFDVSLSFCECCILLYISVCWKQPGEGLNRAPNGVLACERVFVCTHCKKPQ